MMLNERGPAATVDDDLRWRAVSAKDPCPVCSATCNCGTAAFQGGVVVDCCRVVSSWPMTEGGWLHRLPAGDDATWHSAEGAVCAFPMPTARGDRVA
jgi:hypothetical protein